MIIFNCSIISAAKEVKRKVAKFWVDEAKVLSKVAKRIAKKVVNLKNQVIQALKAS